MGVNYVGVYISFFLAIINNMKQDLFLTKEGLAKLKKEYAELIDVKRPNNIEAIRSTRAMGDLSENGGYHAAREEQSFIEGRIQELEDIFKRAKIASSAKTKNIAIGSAVTLQLLGSGEKITYELVGATEADPVNNKVSYESPIGKGLLNKKQGDSVTVVVPVGELKYKILDVN